ncbi:MAG: zinc ribbon domain-containing protein [Ruminococcaceae bacterium]|nr:zinc ribbon domain-containing protein [Oscillospiraceae bacterium]
MSLILSSTYSYNVNKSFTELFDGFFIFTAIVVIMIILGFNIPKYKKSPTAKKRSVVKGLSIALTIIDSFFLLLKIDILAFLFNPYTYLTTSKFGIGNIDDPAAKQTYITVYAIYLAVLIISIIICVAGYRTLCNKKFTQEAFRQNNIIAPQNPNFKACAICGVTVSNHSNQCPRCQSTDFISSADQQTSTETANTCPSCNTVNPEGAVFCHRCGKRLGSDN